MRPDKLIKKSVISIAMTCLGRAFQAASGFDPHIIREIRQMPEGLVIRMQVLPNGPAMTIVKRQDRIIHVPKFRDQADLLISFKNIQCAFPVMAGMINAEEGFAQARMIVKGDIPMAMRLIRCINRLQVLLLPRLITSRVLKRAPRLTAKEHVNRLRLYITGIPFKV